MARSKHQRGAQLFRGALVVEPRYTEPIIDGKTASGGVVVSIKKVIMENQHLA
jgi:hypothetical protein